MVSRASWLEVVVGVLKIDRAGGGWGGEKRERHGGECGSSDAGMRISLGAVVADAVHDLASESRQRRVWMEVGLLSDEG